MSNLPISHAYPQASGPAGTGLFASKDLSDGDLVLSILRPLVCVPDTPRLKETCSWCFLHVERIDAPTEDEHWAQVMGLSLEEYLTWTEPGKMDQPKLMKCGGCGVVRFCGENCQKQSWKHSHKYECKIYKGLFPQVLPNTVRMVMQLLLRRRNGVLPPSDWEAFIKLQHHLGDFKAVNTPAGKEHWQNIQLMARAAKEYSGSKEDLGLVEGMVGRLLINTLTHVTPSYDSLGLALSPVAALLNHSCNPNTVVSFSNAVLSVRTLATIPKGTELTISYIDITNPSPQRQLELSTRYFFTCTCPDCTGHLTLGKPDIPPELLGSDNPSDFRNAADLQKFDNHMLQYLREGSRGDLITRGDALLRLEKLHQAMRRFEFRENYPVYRQPYARIRAEYILALLENRKWLEALIHSLIIYFHVDPVLFQQDWHPVRVVHTWVLVRLVEQISIMEGENDKGMVALREWLKPHWGFILELLIREVERSVGKSHGKDSAFAKEVRMKRENLTKSAVRQFGREIVMTELDEFRNRRKLRRIADEGVKWWRSWLEKARKGTPANWEQSDDADDANDAAYSYLEDMDDYQWKQR